MFYKEIKNIKQILINDGFPNYIGDEQINRIIKNVSQKNKHCNIPANKPNIYQTFYRNQLPYNYKLDGNILKTLIHRNILSTDHAIKWI